MLEVLTNPNKFFEARMKGEESLRIPVLIILISGIIGGISAFLITGMTMELLREALPPEAMGIASTIGGISAFIGAVVVSFVIWVVFAAIFFGISSIFKGEGKFKRTLEFVGYGYIPMIIGGVVSAIFMYHFVYYVFPTMSFPPLTDPAKTAEALKPLLKSSTMLLSSAIGILFMLWSANIWVFGLKHARNLSTKNAVITVAIPVAAYILFSVYQMGVM
jgi:hypothetical protein